MKELTRLGMSSRCLEGSIGLYVKKHHPVHCPAKVIRLIEV